MRHPRHLGHTPDGTPTNRAQRRAARQAPPDVASLAAQYRCPDCDASTTLACDALGLWRLTVAHDETCPAYRAMRPGERR